MKRHYHYVHFTDEKQRPREVKYFPRVTQLVNRRSRNPEPHSVPPHSVASLCGFQFSWADTQEVAYVKFLTLKNPLWLMSSFPLKTSTQGQFPSSSSFQDGSSKWPSQESRRNVCSLCVVTACNTVEHSNDGAAQRICGNSHDVGVAGKCLKYKT